MGWIARIYRCGSASVSRSTGCRCRVAPGEWLGVIGPNGAGKSTLLRALAGVVAATGSISIGGRDAASMSRAARARQVALVAQKPLVPDGITVADYVLLGRTPHLGRFAIETRHDIEVVGEALDMVALSGFTRRQLSSLSGGEQQRAFLARALAQQAPILLLDEPTSALDIGHQQDALDLVDDLRRSQGLVVITTLHDLILAGRYPDRLVLLAEGQVVAEGPAPTVLTEELLAEHYGAAVRIIHDDHGTVVVPIGREREST